MADNVAVTPGLGATIATDDIGGAQYQRVKLIHGADGVNDGDVSSANGLPVNVIAGGPAQYTEGDTDATITGTAIMWESSGNVLNAVGTNAPLPVSAAIADGSANSYLSASATMNQSSGAGLFPAVMVGQFDDVTPTAITENRFGNVRMSGNRNLYVTIRDAAGNERGLNIDASGQISVVPKPATSGGLSIGKKISAASTNATSLKGSAGQVYTIYAHNTNAAVRYLKLYNKATSPTVGTDTPVMTLPIPAATTGNGFVLDTGGLGIAFTTGIAYALTTGVADADTGAVAADEIVLTILYK